MTTKHTDPARVAGLPTGDLLTENEVATALHVSRKCLANWRWAGRGPKFVKVGQRLVRYPARDLLEFIERGAREVA